MEKQDFFKYCLDTFGTSPDYPFNDNLETAVLRHKDNSKWYAILMRVSRRKFGFSNDEITDIVNLKLPLEVRGSFCKNDGVYPAYHMNKYHWISVILSDANSDTIKFLTDVSFNATKSKKRK